MVEQIRRAALSELTRRLSNRLARIDLRSGRWNPKSATALPSSDNHAGYGECEDRHGDEGEPRGSVLRTGKVVTEKEQHQ